MIIPKQVKYTMYRSTKIHNPREFWMLLLFLYIGFTNIAQAQMFSVQPERDTQAVPALAITYGHSYSDFAYRGPAGNIGSVTDYSFNETLSRIQAELDGFRAHATFGRGLGLNENVYTQFGAEIKNGIMLVPGRQLSLVLPVKLSTDYVIIRNSRLTNTNDEFRQNTVGAHSGLDMRARITPKTRFTSALNIGYAFSVTGFGISGGSAVDWSSVSRLYFDRIVGDYGITVGFDMYSRKYNLDDQVFNYLMTQQTLVFGITF
jgi:hypothetical protein